MEIIKQLAIKHPDLGPNPLADELWEQYGVKLNQSTVWRALKRERIRYAVEYKRRKPDPKLYCLDTPGLELQMDGRYPFGRGRKIVGFDAIDDCSR